MTRILIVEDETDIADVLRDYLRREGHQTDHVTDGREALRHMLETPPDLTLLDVMLPGLDGLSVLQQARVHTQHPVIMLTARTEEVDRLLGLAHGADDYVCKPFSPREVVARVAAVLRRTRAPQEVAAAAHGMELDESCWHASLGGQPLNLTRREFSLLRVLARQPGRIFSRARLLELAYEDDVDVTERAIDSHVKNLRRKLSQAAPEHEWIRSVYGVGFSFEPPPAPAAPRG